MCWLRTRSAATTCGSLPTGTCATSAESFSWTPTMATSSRQSGRRATKLLSKDRRDASRAAAALLAAVPSPSRLGTARSLLPRPARSAFLQRAQRRASAPGANASFALRCGNLRDGRDAGDEAYLQQHVTSFGSRPIRVLTTWHFGKPPATPASVHNWPHGVRARFRARAGLVACASRQTRSRSSITA